METEIIEKIRPIRLLLMDVDGTLSDGRLHYSASWEESKSFDVKDGFGIWLLHHFGFKTGLITGRESRMVSERARELHIEIVYQGRFQKDRALIEIQEKYGYSREQIAFVGDDVFDLPVIIRSGFSAAPADAHAEVRKRVDYVSELAGGRGAVRDVCELLLKYQGHWDAVMNLFLV